MATFIGKETQVVKLLTNLVELDFDAIGAYQAAIDRFESPAYKGMMQQFMQDHERHTRDLSPLIIELGGSPPTSGDLKEVLIKGKVVLGQITGDSGILSAMQSNEDDTNTAYERAVERLDITDRIRAVLARGLEDERRHRAWITQELDRIKMGVSQKRDGDKGVGSSTSYGVGAGPSAFIR